MKSLRKRREKMGMTMAELSRLTGVSSNFISEIETGSSTCSFETLEKIVFALSDYVRNSTTETKSARKYATRV